MDRPLSPALRGKRRSPGTRTPESDYHHSSSQTLSSNGNLNPIIYEVFSHLKTTSLMVPCLLKLKIKYFGIRNIKILSSLRKVVERLNSYKKKNNTFIYHLKLKILFCNSLGC